MQEVVFMMTASAIWLWAPRVLGVLTSLFIGLFALDAFGAGRPFAQALPEFLVHLIPAIVLLAIVAVSFRRPWMGAGAFIALGLAYAATVPRGHLDWTIAISGPLLTVGCLFLWSWLCGAGAPA
jgi:hypothetical protein